MQNRRRLWPIPRSPGLHTLQRHDQRAVVEDQAKLVPGRDGRQDDATTGSAFHVRARAFDSRRGCGQSRDLRVATGGGRHAHRKGNDLDA